MSSSVTAATQASQFTDLPTDRVGAVAQEIAQLQALLDLFEEHFDLQSSAIQIGRVAGTPTKIIGQKLDISGIQKAVGPIPHRTGQDQSG